MKKLISFALALTMACGSEAIVKTNTGASYTGEITGHDNGAVFINGQRVSRSDVRDIDHPGNVAAIIGTIVAGIGVITAGTNCTAEKRAEDPTPCTSSGLWMFTGVPIMIYGLVTHSESVEAAGE